MKRVELIVNPSAGQGKIKELLPKLTRRLREHFVQVHVHLTKQPGDGARRVQEVGHDTDLIIAAGGDGTVHELANAVCSHPDRPRFAILPGGTCNDFSRALGIKQHIPDALEQIIKGQPRRVDVVRNQQGRYFLNFWGIGLITRVSTQITPENKERFGRLAYYISAAQNLLHPRSFTLEAEWDEGHFQGEATMLLVGNGSFIGGMEAFFPHSRLDDGKMDVLVIKETSLDSLWSLLVSNMTREWPLGEDLLYFHTEHLTIQANPPQTIDSDGEEVGTTPSELVTLPGHLTVLVGE